MIHSTKDQDKGFTLVELLIVIVILGILATVTVFAVGGLSNSAQTTACEAEEKTIVTAAQAWLANENETVITGADDDARMQTLVDANFLTEGSTTYTVAADGSVNAVVGGDCAA